MANNINSRDHLRVFDFVRGLISGLIRLAKKFRIGYFQVAGSWRNFSTSMFWRPARRYA